MEADTRSRHPAWTRVLLRYFSTEVVNSLATVAGVAIFTRLVQPAEYGQYALTIAASGVAMAIAGEWLQASALRLVPGRAAEEREAALTAAVRLAYTVAAGVVAGTIVLSGFAPDSSARALIFAGGALAALSILFLTATVLFQATMRADLFTRLRSGYSVLRVLGALILVALFGRSPVLLVGGAVLALMLLLPLTMPRIRTARTPAPEAVESARSSFLSFGLPLIGWYLASQTLNLSDRFFLEGLKGSADVGLYSVTYSLAMGVVAGIVQPILSTVHPLIVEAWHVHGEAVARERLRAALRALALVGPLLVAGLGVFGPSLLRVLAPERYTTRGLLGGLLGAGIMLWFAGLFLQKELELQLKSRRLRLNLALAAAANVTGNALLIPRFGLIGAAIATISGYGVYVALTIQAGWSGIPGIPIRTVLAATLGTAAFVMVGLALKHLEFLRSPSARVFVAAPLSCLSYLAAIALTGELSLLRRDLFVRSAGRA